MTYCILRATPAPDHKTAALDAAVAGFFDLRSLALSAVALLDSDAAQEDVVRVLNQLAGRATDLAGAADAAAVRGTRA